jgi:hypothetical protein
MRSESFKGNFDFKRILEFQIISLGELAKSLFRLEIKSLSRESPILIYRLSNLIRNQNTFLIPGVYACFTQKTNFIMPNKLEKYSHAYLHILCVHTQFVKKYFLWAMQKGQKKCVAKRLIFSSDFCHFYIGYIKSHFFLKLLRGHVGHEDVL